MLLSWLCPPSVHVPFPVSSAHGVAQVFECYTFHKANKQSFNSFNGKALISIPVAIYRSLFFSSPSSCSLPLACTLDVIRGGMGMGMGKEECDVDGEVDVQVQFQRHMPSSLLPNECTLCTVHVLPDFRFIYKRKRKCHGQKSKGNATGHKSLGLDADASIGHASLSSHFPVSLIINNDNYNKQTALSIVPLEKGALTQGPLNLIRGPSLTSNLQVRLHKESEMRVKESPFIDRSKSKGRRRIQTTFFWVSRSVCPL